MAPALPQSAAVRRGFGLLPAPEHSAPGPYAIHTDLMLTNSRMPYSDSSRP